jgi:phosphoribosylformylglycinamidine synthase I
VRVGVVVFPGSNCDHDAYEASRLVLDAETEYLWHSDHDLRGCDVVVLPGGFAHGDYLRAGAIARFSPIMREVAAFARDGGIVVGICNGFQVLCEVGLLPGALLRNASRRFVCKTVRIRVERTDAPVLSDLLQGTVLSMPVAHGEGNYYAPPDEFDSLRQNGRIAFRYVDERGEPTKASNPNGSLDNVAGIVNEAGNVLGMMPHPERACEAVLGSDDGAAVLRSLGRAVEARKSGCVA